MPLYLRKHKGVLRVKNYPILENRNSHYCFLALKARAGSEYFEAARAGRAPGAGVRDL